MKKVLLTKKFLLLCLLLFVTQMSFAVTYTPSDQYWLGKVAKNSSGEDVRRFGDGRYNNQIAISGSFYDGQWTYRNNNGGNEWYVNVNTPQTLSIMNLFSGDKVKINSWSGSGKSPSLKSNNASQSNGEWTMNSTGSMDFSIPNGMFITSIEVTPSNNNNRIAFDLSGQPSSGYYRCQLSSRQFNEPPLSVYPSNAFVEYTLESYDKMNGTKIEDVNHQVAAFNKHDNHEYDDLLFKNIGWLKVTAKSNNNEASYWVEVWDNEACYEFVNNNTRFQFIPNPDEALTEASQRGGFMANRVVTGVGGIEVKFGIPNWDASNNLNQDNHYMPNTTVVYYNNGHMVSFTNANNGWWDRAPHNDYSWPTEGTFYMFKANAKGKLKFGGIKASASGNVYLVKVTENSEFVWNKQVFKPGDTGYMETSSSDSHYDIQNEIILDDGIEMEPGTIYYLQGQANDNGQKWGVFLLEWFSYETDLKLSAKYGVAAECGATSVTSLETVTGAEQATIVGFKGTIQNANVSLSNNHIEFSNITYNTTEENKKGGAIKVRLSQGSSYVDYVMTIPYGTHVWDFRKSSDQGSEFTNAGLVADINANTNDLSRVYKVHRRADGKWSELESPILAAHSAVEGNNAFFMSYTNGLVFLTSADHFGAGETVNEYGSTYEKSHGLAGIDDDEEYGFPASTVKEAELVWMQGSSTILFPGVKAGQYIKIWTRRHSENKGETWTARNLVDLEGVLYNENIPFKQRGINDDRVTYKDDMTGGALFRVPDNYIATNDLTKLPAITMSDDGWVKIYKIEIMDECEPDLYLTEDHDWNNFYFVDDDSEYASIVVVDGESVTRAYDGHVGRVGATQGHTCTYEVVKDDNVDADVVYKKSSYGDAYNRVEITYNGGYGLVKIIQRELGDNEGEHQYVYSKNETYIAVGELTTQTYPYTWDFTNYNMFLGTNTNQTAAKMAAAKTAGAYGIWTGTEKPFSQPAYVDENFLPQVNVTAQPNTLTRKPLFAQGSQLSALNEGIAETEGLGIYRPFQSAQKVFNYYFTVNGTFAKQERKYNAYDLQNDALKATGDDVEGVGKINVPKVDKDMYVFVKASAEPISVSTNAVKVTQYEGHVNNFDLVNGVYVYKVNTKGDVTLTFSSAASVSEIGVTDQFKQIVNEAGKTTESRAIDIDYKQTNNFVEIDMHAYRAHTYVDDNNGSTGKISIAEVGPTAKNQGLLLFCEGGGNVSCPFFVPAINNAPVTYSTNDNKMVANVTAGTAPASDANTYRYVFSNIYYNGKDEQQPSSTYGFYKAKESGWLKANMAYLELNVATDQIGYSNQYVLLDTDDSSLTDIKGVEIENGVTDMENGSPVYFNLNGMRLNGVPSKKGIYIMNGKKIYVK